MSKKTDSGKSSTPLFNIDVGTGAGIGLGIGAAIGAIFQHISLGMIFGITIGSTLGVLFSSGSSQKASNILSNNKHVFVPILVTVLLIISSFFPLIQVVLVEVAGLYKPLSTAVNVQLMPFYFVTNSFISTILLFLFYKAKGMAGIIFSNLLAIILLYPTLIYVVNFMLEGSDPPYMLPLLISALLYGGIFLGVAALKMKYEK